MAATNSRGCGGEQPVAGWRPVPAANSRLRRLAAAAAASWLRRRTADRGGG
jgi:hypothetical protein